MQNATAPTSDRHVYGLDLLRCAAAFLVAGFHFTRKLTGADQLLPFGWVGVEIFFLISGYVIAYSAQQSDAMRFLRSRFLRLYPAAWIVAVLSGTILAGVPSYYWHTLQVFVFPDPVHVLNSVLLTGIGMSASYWTLPVELAFYGCVFLLLFVGRIDWLRNFAIVLTIYSTPYLALLGLHDLRLIDLPFLEFDLSGWNALLLRHGPFFAIGLFMFAARQRRLAVHERYAVGAAVLLALVEIACRAAEQLDGGAISNLVPLPLLILESEAVFVAAMAAMMAALRWNSAFPLRLRPFSRALGLSTYPFYLAHEILGGLTIFLLLRFGAHPVVATFGALTVVLAMAYIISSRIEPLFRRAIATRLVRANTAAKPGGATLGAT